MGGRILPAVSAFYPTPGEVVEIANQRVEKILGQISIDAQLFWRWGSDAMESDEKKVLRMQSGRG